ncbi:MAG TPA: hypothetical protein DIU00_02000 [Phycisphaerales bacterium]|nr:hypothetical protein [Phycisphaerales bacterium]
MKKRGSIWPIAVLVMCFLVMLYTVKTCNGGRRLSELDVERQYSRDVSVPVTGAPILPLKEDEINPTNTTIRQDRLQASDQPRPSTDLENITHPQICASEWLGDGVTVQEVLRCIDEYEKKTKPR